MDAIIYVRLSSYRGDADPTTSPERQAEACRQYAAAKGWRVVDVIEDLDVSGSDKGLRLDRHGLARIRHMLPDIDVIIFAKLDRLARNVVDFHKFSEECATQGVALVSVAESLDLSTPMGRFVTTVIAGFAELEGATIAARAAEGKAAARAQGRWVSGRPPFGFVSVDNPAGRGKVLQPVPSEAAVLREALHRVAAGEPFTRAARRLNSQGVKPRRTAAQWSPQALKQSLNSVSARTLLWTPQELVLLRQALAPRTPNRQGRRPTTLLGGGILVCHGCGTRMNVHRPGGRVAYSCPLSSRGQHCPASATIAGPLIETYVAERWLAGWSAMSETQVVRASDAAAQDLAVVANRIHELRERLTTAPAAELPDLVAEISAAETEHAALLARPTARMNIIVETGRTLGSAWYAGSLEDRRELLAATVAPLRIQSAGGRGRRMAIEARIVNGYRLDGPAAIDEVETP